jgi:hypothetical protein
MSSLFDFSKKSELHFELIDEYKEKSEFFRDSINRIFVIKVNKLNSFIDLAYTYSVTKLFNMDFNDTFIKELLSQKVTLYNNKVNNNCDRLKEYVKSFQMPNECKRNECFMSEENLHIVFVFEDTQEDNIFKTFVPFTTLSKARKYDNDMVEIVTDFFQYYFQVKPCVEFKYACYAKKILSNQTNKNK